MVTNVLDRYDLEIRWWRSRLFERRVRLVEVVEDLVRRRYLGFLAFFWVGVVERDAMAGRHESQGAEEVSYWAS